MTAILQAIALARGIRWMYRIVLRGDIGSVGDGHHDATHALQAYINWHCQAGEIRIPHGSYLISQPIQLPARTFGA
jgi:polygalacturonase